MLTHPTLDQLRALKLDGMVQAFIELEAQEEARNLAHAEWLALLLDREAADRGTRRFQTRLRVARLPHSQATDEDGPASWEHSPTASHASTWRPRDCATSPALHGPPTST
jgi:DNA replication protein DnaC